MSRDVKIVAYLLIIISAIVYKQIIATGGEPFGITKAKKKKEFKPVESTGRKRVMIKIKGEDEGRNSSNKSSGGAARFNPSSNSSSGGNYTRPKEGFSPYDKYFGRGIYDKSVMNEFVIKNSFSTDAVVLLINAYTGRKVRNEYIRKGSNFSMTSVPNGTYYMEWTSGEDWNPNLDLGQVTGGFETNGSYTKTRDRDDWMGVTGYDQWTVTLYRSTSGDVESETLSSNEFGK